MKTFAPTQAEINTECRKYLDILNFYANSNFKDFKNVYFMFLVQKERLSGVFRAASLVLEGEAKAEYLLKVVSFYEQVESVCVEHLFNLVSARGKPTKAMAKAFKDLHKEVKGKAYGIRNASADIRNKELETVLDKLLIDKNKIEIALQYNQNEYNDLKSKHDTLENVCSNLENKVDTLEVIFDKTMQTLQHNLGITENELKQLCKKQTAVLGTKQAKQARYMHEVEGLTPEIIAGIMEVSLKTIVDALKYKTY